MTSDADQSSPLRIAALRVLDARAQLGIARGSIFPQQQEVFGEFSKTLLSKNAFPGNIPGLPRSARLLNTGFDAAWELDVWGRFRRNIESANAKGTPVSFNALWRRDREPASTLAASRRRIPSSPS